MQQLNKLVCLKCFRESAFHAEAFRKEDFHYYWETKRCICKAQFNHGGLFWNIYTTPPDECPYLLEHLMEVQPC